MCVRFTECLFDFMLLASLGTLLLGIHITAFFIGSCYIAFCALSFTVVFSVVGCLLYLRFSSVCFCCGCFCIARTVASPSGTR